MPREKKLISKVLMLWFLLLIGGSGLRAEYAPEEKANSCMVCHSTVKAQYMDDIHFKRGISCDTCHGGDPAEFELENSKASSTDYKGGFSKLEGVKLCASCHSDEVLMRQYGLSTDQYQQYLTSRHGRMLVEDGDQGVASCVDCHGAHSVLPASDPSSSVFRKNLPYTCGKCHSDDEHMKRYGFPTDQLDDYLHSVHGVQLIENNNRAVPECAQCHGVHGASAPGTTEVFNVCGQCHPFIREQFMRSPHFEAEKEGLMNGCVACHSDHRIVRADADSIIKKCRECHEESSDAYETGMAMKSLIHGAWERYYEGRAEVDTAVVRGLMVTDEEMMMEEAFTLLTSLRTSQHTLDLDEMRSEAAKATSIVNSVIATLEHELVSIRIYKLVLIPVWLFVSGMLALFYAGLKRRAAKKRR